MSGIILAVLQNIKNGEEKKMAGIKENLPRPTYWRTCRALANEKRLRLFKAVVEHDGRYTVREYAQSDEISLLVRDDIWRQEDAATNSLSMLAQSLYAHDALQHRKWSDLQDLCWHKGRNWNDLETAEKRGVCIYRHRVVVQGRQGPVERMKFFIDREIPIFASRDADDFWRQFA